MTRPELVAAVATLERFAADGCTPADAAWLAGELERVRAIAWNRVLVGSQPEPAPAVSPAAPTLDVVTAARFLKLSPTTLRRLVAAGDIPHLRVGRRVLFRRATLERFAADRERSADRS